MATKLSPSKGQPDGCRLLLLLLRAAVRFGPWWLLWWLPVPISVEGDEGDNEDDEDEDNGNDEDENEEGGGDDGDEDGSLYKSSKVGK